ncbi:MAG TPA: DMT family transporter [Verrucomicrobiae bacterium]|jgi:drug/metabolite transporter (DMT)-like permease
MHAPHTPRLGFAALLAGATGIAFAPIFVRVSETGPSATAFYRIAFALPLLWLWMRTERGNEPHLAQPVTRRDFALLALAGLFFAGDLAVWHWSIKLTSVANSTLLANCAPIFVTLGARMLFGERITTQFLLALVLALAGAAVLVGASFQLSARHLAGDALGVATAVFYAAYMLSIKRLRERFSTATIMTWTGLSCAPTLLVVAAVSREQLVATTAHGWILLAGLALISQVGGQTLIAYGFKHLTASLASLSLLFQPVMATLFAWMLLGEPLRPLQFIGGAVVLIAITLASRASSKPVLASLAPRARVS